MITRESWLKALSEAGLPTHDDDDPNATTIDEFAAMFGLAQSTAKHRLEKLVAIGKATRSSKYVTNDNGRTNRCRAYRLL